MVRRIYVEKKPALRLEADGLLRELQTLLGIRGLTGLRVVNRYDVEGLSASEFDRAVTTVFSEPQLDETNDTQPEGGDVVFAVEYLPGQFDQRADSAAQCLQLLTGGEKPTVRTAKVYLLSGQLTSADVARIKAYVINPVEAREASLSPVQTLTLSTEQPEFPAVLDNFSLMGDAALEELRQELGLAMDLADLKCCRAYFAEEGRQPTLTEIRILDTYWSDHCRHTTFGTILKNIRFEDEAVRRAYERYLYLREATNAGSKPVTLMDMATRGAKYLKKTGDLTQMDESDEINACTVKIQVDEDGTDKPWLLLFKNETHNHPTEIEPFGGAATCIGGAIRDPLAGRGYVYQAMRITGAADPRTPIDQTIPGKLPQRKIVRSAANGYSSYGNQIGLATGLVQELYHPGYAAKRMELGAVVGAAPEGNVRREEPQKGDQVILLGGRTGRDGIGGATGASKSHNTKSVSTCASEVQKGNAPEERKLQRLFRRGDAVRLIKRCNDFGAGGVSVAVGELAASLEINLDCVTKKYEGLDATELAISESQERMAIVVAAEDVAPFMAIAREENLEATVVAAVTDTGRLVMKWRGQTVADLSRAFLDTNGASRETEVVVEAAKKDEVMTPTDFRAGLLALAGELNTCSQRGLAQRFDSTIGAASVLMPFGGARQRTPAQAMAAKLPVLGHETTTCSIMSWGADPYRMARDPYRGAYLAVVDSVAKVLASGGTRRQCWLTLQEYFEKLGSDPARWGKPTAALLGALSAQVDLKCGAIGGKDSMSGSFNELDVPPTLVSFAISVGKTDCIFSNEFKKAGNTLTLLRLPCATDELPGADDLCATLDTLEELLRSGQVESVSVVGHGGVAEAALKACLGNGLGCAFEKTAEKLPLFSYLPAAFVLESKKRLNVGEKLGTVTNDGILSLNGQRVSLAEAEKGYDGVLEEIYPTDSAAGKQTAAPVLPVQICPYVAPKIGVTRPQVLIPVFPGTNCEYDSARAVERAGMTAKVLVVNNQSAAGIADSVERFVRTAGESQIIFLPGGFSGGDEPDGSGKFITAFFRNEAVCAATDELLHQRDGLMLGICNGFQALIKLGLVPFGEIRQPDGTAPTLTYNTIGRHQSGIVNVRVVSNRSPWLQGVKPGEVYSVPISHGEGRFLCSKSQLEQLAANGQIATQYADASGVPGMGIDVNPNGSVWAVEGITSPDGRIFGKMGHAERIGKGLYQNVPGNYDMHLFESAKAYFTL
jgi:phosphoribosylformylglycinamidine synthase